MIYFDNIAYNLKSTNSSLHENVHRCQTMKIILVHMKLNYFTVCIKPFVTIVHQANIFFFTQKQ